MGWFDGNGSVISSSTHGHHRKHNSSSKHSSHSRSGGSIFGGGDKHRSSTTPRAPSIFGVSLGEDKPRRASSVSRGGDSHKHSSSRSSFFGFGGSRSNSSYYKRSPRSGFLKRMYTRLRRLLRDLIHYMKRNPIKVFMLVILPLITGGALTTLLSKFGIRLPAGVEKMFNTLGGKPEGGKGMEFERERIEAKGFDFGNAMGGIGGAVSLAKMFM